MKGMVKAAKGDAKYGSSGVINTADNYEKHATLTGNHGHTDSFTDLLRDNNDTDGSVMYYSLGQIVQELNNASSTDHSNIALAAVKGFGADSSAPTADMVKKGKYTFTRPFNMMFDATNYKSVAFAS